jgi:hypothetical protein
MSCGGGEAFGGKQTAPTCHGEKVGIKRARKMEITKDQWAIYHINKLRPQLRDYAFEYWQFLSGRAAQPDPNQFGIRDDEAHEARVKLAAIW